MSVARDMSENIDLTRADEHLQALLEKRQHPKTICPSEAARALSIDELTESGASHWRDLMGPLRRYAFALRDQGRLEILQKGHVLPLNQSLDDTVGPIRLRKLSNN